MDWLDCPVIEQVEGRVSGAPVIRGSRVRPEDLLNNLELSEAELSQQFGISREDVREVLAFYERYKGQLALTA